MRELFRERFATRTRDEWASHFEGTDACVAPVLSLAEAPDHPHNVSRGTFVDVAGVVQPAPAPRFSVTHTEASPVHGRVGQDTDHVLTRLGFDAAEIAEMRDSGSVA